MQLHSLMFMAQVEFHILWFINENRMQKDKTRIESNINLIHDFDPK